MVNRPFALPERELVSTMLDLPVPPSVNRTRKIDWGGIKNTRKWMAYSDVLVMAAQRSPENPLGLRKVPGRFDLKIVMSEDARLDLDNGIKCLIDYLRRIDLITDDNKKYLRRLEVMWGFAPLGVRVTIMEVA